MPCLKALRQARDDVIAFDAGELNVPDSQLLESRFDKWQVAEGRVLAVREAEPPVSLVVRRKLEIAAWPFAVEDNDETVLPSQVRYRRDRPAHKLKERGDDVKRRPLD